MRLCNHSVSATAALLEVSLAQEGADEGDALTGTCGAKNSTRVAILDTGQRGIQFDAGGEYPGVPSAPEQRHCKRLIGVLECAEPCGNGRARRPRREARPEMPSLGLAARAPPITAAGW